MRILFLILLITANYFCIPVKVEATLGKLAEPLVDDSLSSITRSKAQSSLPDFDSMSLNELKLFANDKYFSDDCPAAYAAIEAIIQRSSCSLQHLNHECLEVYMNLAVCQIQAKKFEEARTILRKLLEFSREEKADNNGGMDEPDCLFFLAECNYRMGSYQNAETLYREALTKYRKLLDPLSLDLSPSLEGLAGCLCGRKVYCEAVPLFTELVRIDTKNSGPNSLKTAWSLLNLSNALRHTGDDKQADPLYEKAAYIFRQVNVDRILADIKAKKNYDDNTMKLVQERLRNYVFGEGDRPDFASGGAVFKEITADLDDSKTPLQRPFDFDNWRLKATKMVDAPGLVTVDPEKPLKGVIVCVHGLGLHHKTYRLFAEEMAARGFSVVAFDVRGFGSYKENKGYDRLDLDGCVADIAKRLTCMRRDYPNVSIFLLGESMGGAIALRVAADHTELIDGLVSSVPSGSRFGAAKTNVNVAARLLTNANKPFDIGTHMVAQATKKEALREQWAKDPEARLKLSAMELLQFQQFMNQNLKAAERLTKLPVVIFQGYGDKLVRPDGTLALYNAIASEDKDLVFVGHLEHLIFEEGQFKPSVINSLNGWLCSHLKNGP